MTACKETYCGRSHMGTVQLCLLHAREAEERHPQGWRYTPGDLCKHGTYVGGCMEDLMCFACEEGYD